jgi:hypothetical protein
MNIHKLIKKAESFLNSDERKRKEKRKFLKRVIKKLKKHEQTLKERLETTSKESLRGEIQREIALAHAQRKKGLGNLKALKKAPK